MLPTDLLITRQQGETLVPKKLPLTQTSLDLAQQQIHCLQSSVGLTQGQLKAKLLELEGDRSDYRIQRGLAHLLKNHFATFDIVSPLEPTFLRQRIFTEAATTAPGSERRQQVLETVAQALSQELERDVLPPEIETGLYADLTENRILTEFEAPTSEALLHRYNLSQVQGIFYRATHIVIHAHRNDPGEYKLLFRYLKLFQLMAYIEGDADTGFTITIDGPASLFKASTRYGLSLAKMLPALLHVSRWHLKAKLQRKDPFSGQTKVGQFTLDHDCDLVSHYPPGKPFDSMLEESFAKQWQKAGTAWRLEREVDLVPIPGSVMIPDFRLVHPNGQVWLLEIIGYWRPEYLRKKFAQVKRSQVSNFVLAISERLNLAKAGVDFHHLPVPIVWFKTKLRPQAILEVLPGVSDE